LTTPHHLEGEFKNNSLKDLTVGTNLIELQQKNFLLTVIFCFRWIIQDEKKQSIKTNPTGQCDHNLNSDRKQNSWMALVLSTRLRVNLKKSNRLYFSNNPYERVSIETKPEIQRFNAQSSSNTLKQSSTKSSPQVDSTLNELPKFKWTM
jgi:hypothetical protein